MWEGRKDKGWRVKRKRDCSERKEMDRTFAEI